MSQPALAKKAHTNVETIVRAEQSGNVTVFKLLQIAEALETEISEFWCGEKKDAAPPSVWSRLNPEQRAYLEKLAYRQLGERAPQGDD
jgi:transcriptional regulator with XRE-family HTH domain